MSADFIERFRLKPSHITAECDPAVLLEWRGELVRIIKEISFQLDELGDGPHVTFADRSALFGSHTREMQRLTALAKDAEWSGDYAKADRLFAEADHHRNELAMHGDLAPLF